MLIPEYYLTSLTTIPIIPLHTLFTTENGCDVPGENDMSMQEALDDQFRINYYRQYLAAMDRAIEEGVPGMLEIFC